MVEEKESCYTTQNQWVKIRFLKDVYQGDNRIAKEGELLTLLPVFVSSCMEIGKEKVYPVEFVWQKMQDGRCRIKITAYQKEFEVSSSEVEITMGPYERKKQRPGCIPCKNCGRC